MFTIRVCVQNIRRVYGFRQDGEACSEIRVEEGLEKFVAYRKKEERERREEAQTVKTKKTCVWTLRTCPRGD